MEEQQRRLLLVEPPFYRLYKPTYSLTRYPLSLGYLAGEVRRHTDWNVLVYNADFHPNHETIKVGYWSGVGFANYLANLKDPSGQVWQEVRAAIADYKPTVVGISAKSQNFASARIVARVAKEIDDQTVVIVGGPHSSMVGAALLDYPEIDIGVRGEGERTIIELLAAMDAGRPVDTIPGVVCRKSGQIVEAPLREFIADLDSLCFPHEYAPEVLKDYHQYPVTAFKSVFATRGCPYNCFFCGSRSIWGRKVRFRSPENVARELAALQQLGLRFTHFDDDTFGVTPRYIGDLCDAITLRAPGLKWSCEIHARLVNDGNIARMKDAGCFDVQMGIESGNNAILSAMRKNITIEEALDACAIIKQHGLRLAVFFIVGFPQETEASLRDTSAAMKKVKSDVLVYSIFTPYPGTEAFEFCKERGLVGDDYDVALYNHQSPANSFCLDIEPERFRVLVSRMEKGIDRQNARNKIKRIFAWDTLNKVRELGVRGSLKRGLRVVAGR